MAILGTLLKRGIKLRKMIEQEKVRPYELQRDELAALLDRAKHTAFGKAHDFAAILHEVTFNRDPHAFYELYKRKVPVYTYNSLFNQWWHRTLEGKRNVCWPGRVKYFALSSGTSEAASKHIPVTKAMLKAIHKTSVREILSLADYPNLPGKLFETGMLALGGSTHLNYNGTYFEGDLSGINASQIPFWFQHFYKPGMEIASITDWNTKLDEIVEEAPRWNIGFIAGVPAWIQILMEKIIDRYQVKTIHDIWPNLAVYTHGGVSFEPYRKGFEKLLARPLIYIETYLASEGFVAYQLPGRTGMQMVLNNGMFYEFVPFNEQNFGPDGEMVPHPETLMIDQVEEGREYALLLSTCAGAWRYLIGDVVKFVNKRESEIIITGRTKHFLSLCGEHLSVDNMNRAVQQVAEEMGIVVREFTVAGIPHESLFAHHWYIGTDDAPDPALLREKLDQRLMQLNDDYRVERSAALKEIFVDVLPTEVFYGWMEHRGKIGGQTKFPRVMKRQIYEDWEAFVKNRKK